MAEFGYTQLLWNKKYQQLVEFKRNNGHCIVPTEYEEDASLGMWVGTQRQYHANNKLRVDRKELLDEIGFVWKAREVAANGKKTWHQQYEQLIEFKRNNGHCVVPSKYQEDRSLGHWVNKQRQCHSNKKLRLDRKGLLDKIGFVWRVAISPPVRTDDPKWNKQYEKLVTLKRKNGHCIVPDKWVRTQRGRHANNKMLPDGKKLLDEIDFVWKARTLGARSSNTDVSCR
jgi:hypothetical protein